MMHCWKLEPADRPDFDVLGAAFSAMMSTEERTTESERIRNETSVYQRIVGPAAAPTQYDNDTYMRGINGGSATTDYVHEDPSSGMELSGISLENDTQHTDIV